LESFFSLSFFFWQLHKCNPNQEGICAINAKLQSLQARSFPNALSASKQNIAQRPVKLQIGFLTRYLMIHTDPKTLCAEVKSARDQEDNPRFMRKFNKWIGINVNDSCSLAVYAMHPISKSRMYSHVAVIRLKELPKSGFRVLSADAVSIESLASDAMALCRGFAHSDQVNNPLVVVCFALYVIEAIDCVNSCTIHNSYTFGDYSNLHYIQKKVATEIEDGRKAELIKKLNEDLVN
jgi:hypothetical protein